MIAAALRQLFPPPFAVALRDAKSQAVTLPAAEAAIVENAVPKRRREFAAGREAARAALQEIGFAAAVIGCSADRAPQWPDGATGSIAHADEQVVAVVARKAEIVAVGVDLERDGAVREEIWRQIMTEPEMEVLRRLPADDRPRWATVVFCAKEAFYKFQHPLTWTWLEFTAVTVEVDAAHGRFIVHGREPIRIDGAAVSSFPGRFAFADGFVLAGVWFPARSHGSR